MYGRFNKASNNGTNVIIVTNTFIYFTIAIMMEYFSISLKFFTKAMLKTIILSINKRQSFRIDWIEAQSQVYMSMAKTRQEYIHQTQEMFPELYQENTQEDLVESEEIIPPTNTDRIKKRGRPPKEIPEVIN